MEDGGCKTKDKTQRMKDGGWRMEDGQLAKLLRFETFIMGVDQQRLCVGIDGFLVLADLEEEDGGSD